MLYLEDILEVIENVPQEIRDRTTELRELDLGIQNSHDQIENEIATFFSNAKKMKPQDRDAQYEKIRKEYYKLLDDADEKVNIATNMQDSIERYLRKLDQELEKFKYELEADSPGITEVLEKRSLELDEPAKESQKENRYHHMVNSRASVNNSTEWKHSIKKEEGDAFPQSISPPPSSLTYSLNQIGAGGAAIAAAASQAIAATQQMMVQQQGRRTASLKASYDAITHGVHTSQFTIGSELANAAQSALSASSLPHDSSLISSTNATSASNVGLQHHLNCASGSSALNTVGAVSTGAVGGASATASGSSSNFKSSGSSTGGSSNKRQKKKSSSAASTSTASNVSSTSLGATAVLPNAAGSSVAVGGADASGLLPTVDEGVGDVGTLDSPDWTYDPNEPRYCVCNQVSYGDMVACDNPRCPVEWFHYPCVGITAPPKGKWYCPQCSASMNRRQRK